LVKIHLAQVNNRHSCISLNLAQSEPPAPGGIPALSMSLKQFIGEGQPEMRLNEIIVFFQALPCSLEIPEENLPLPQTVSSASWYSFDRLPGFGGILHLSQKLHQEMSKHDDDDLKLPA
jgi:hypothetical protein